MSENLHTRALQLVAKARVEGLADSERDWLAAHLQDCDFCNEHAQQTDRALRALRTAAISVPAGLASRTQFRVRLRAMELSEREPQRRMLWLACAASWIVGIASAPYVWRMFMARRTHRHAQARLANWIRSLVDHSRAVRGQRPASGERAADRRAGLDEARQLTLSRKA